MRSHNPTTPCPLPLAPSAPCHSSQSSARLRAFAAPPIPCIKLHQFVGAASADGIFRDSGDWPLFSSNDPPGRWS